MAADFVISENIVSLSEELISYHAMQLSYSPTLLGDLHHNNIL